MRLFWILIVLAALALFAQVVATTDPSALNWGRHHYGFLGGAWMAAGIVLALAGFLAVLATPKTTKIPAAPVFVATLIAAGSLFWLGRETTTFLGDGSLWVAAIREGRILWHNEPAALFGQFYLNRFLGSPDPALTFALASVACGLVYVGVVWALARRAIASLPGQVFVWIFLISLGLTRLFYGYVETYPALAMWVAIYVWLGIRYVEGRGSLWGPAMVAVVAIPTHVTAVLLLPSLILLAARGPGRGAGRWVAVLVPVALLAVAVVARWPDPSGWLSIYRPYLEKLLPLGGELTSKQPYTLISLGHLADFVEEQILLGPFVGLAALVLLFTRSFRVDRTAVFLLGAGLPWWAFSFFYNRELGAARDWDLFAIASIPLAVFVAYAVVRHPSWKAQPGRLRLAGASLAAVSLFHLVPWIGVGVNAETGLHHFASLYSDGTRASRFAGSYAYETLSNYYVDLEDFSSAEAALTEAHRFDPARTRVAGNLGSLRLMVGKIPEAVEVLEAAALTDPDNEVIHYQLAGVYKEAGRLEESRASYRRAIDLNADFVQAYLNLALLERQTGKPLAAERTLLLAKERFSSGEISGNLGRLYQDLGRTEEAIIAYREGLELLPEDTAAAFNLGNLLIKAETFEEAASVLARLVERTPEDVEAWTNLGIAFSRSGRGDEAQAAFRRAMEADPRRGEPVFNLAQVLVADNKSDDAIAILREFTARDSTSQYGLTAKALIRRIQARTKP